MKRTLEGPGPLIIVDDSPEDTEILTRCFRRSELAPDYDLLAFDGGPSFLDHMTQVSGESEPMPSIIMLDINMPVMDGFEVLKQLRHQPDFVSLPAIIFVSNSDNPSDISRAQGLGADFAEKFFTIDEGIAFFNGLR